MRYKSSGRIIFGQFISTLMDSVIGRLICPMKCQKVTLFKMSHCFQKDILKIIRFLSGTPMMDCWYWVIQKTATQNSPAITIPFQHFDGSPSLCLECWDWMYCASFVPIISPNAKSSVIPNRLCLLWKLWQTENRFHFISAANYRKLPIAWTRLLLFWTDKMRRGRTGSAVFPMTSAHRSPWLWGMRAALRKMNLPARPSKNRLK